MSKSIYEKYCEENQPKIIKRKSELSLEDAIEELQYYKKKYNELVYLGAVSITARLFKLEESEIEKLVDGDTYWLISE